jgi:hypothetical protein
VNAVPRPLLAYFRSAIPMWVGTIFVVAGSVASVGSLGEWRDARRFERDAVTEQAELVAKGLTNATRDGNTSTRYLVTYRFAARSGDVLEQTEEIPLEDWEALAEGDTFTVRYLSSDPTTARMRSPTPAWVPPLVASITAVFALLGLAIARPGWRRALVLIRVQRHGVAAQATVVEVAPSGVTINRVPQWHLRYEFRDALGRAQRGTSDYLRPHEAAEWRLGDHGAIRYDRDRPTESLWLGRG